MPVFPLRPSGPAPQYSPYSPSRFHIDKRCRHRCTWKCCSIALILLSVVLTAMLAYFGAVNSMRSNLDPSSCILVEDAKVIAADDQMARDSTASVQTPTEESLSTSTTGGWGPSPSLAASSDQSQQQYPQQDLEMDTFRTPQHTTIPPAQFWNIQFRNKQPAFIRFNMSLPWGANFAVYGRRNVAPSITQYDFSEFVKGGRVDHRIKRETNKLLSDFQHAVSFTPLISENARLREQLHHFSPTFLGDRSRFAASSPPKHRLDNSASDQWSSQSQYPEAHLISKRSATGHLLVNVSLLQYLDTGRWYVSVYNDDLQLHEVILTIEEAEGISTACPNDCSGHGSCYLGKCDCIDGFEGIDCSKSVCPVLCSNHGKYGGGLCHCEEGWKGAECDIPLHDCQVADCSGHGRCIRGSCVCQPGWKGPACNIEDCVDPTCSSHGSCVMGRCYCKAGWQGANCSQVDQKVYQCLPGCSEHGTYDLETGGCICEEFWTGPDCSQAVCSLDCGVHGRCDQGQCVCLPGWSGERCDLLPCDSRCAEHGQCKNGTCVCSQGWNGRHCTLPGCVNACNRHGSCVLVDGDYQCQCNEGWAGVDCSVRLEMDCNDEVDNDQDGMIDCSDSECCSHPACNEHIMCLASNDPVEVLLRKQPPSVTASFYQRVKFLVEENSVQSYVHQDEYTERRVSVMRGQVLSPQGLGIVGIRVSVDRDSRFGFTLTRAGGWFDVLVNGGGAVTLQFQRSPFQPLTRTLFVPWNQIVVLPPITMQLGDDADSYRGPPHPTLALGAPSLMTALHMVEPCLDHDNTLLVPVVLSTWMPEKVGGVAGKSLIFAETQMLQESIRIPGSGLHLMYRSSLASGYLSRVVMRLTHSLIPRSLVRVHVRVEIEGSVHTKTYEADPNLTHTFAWNKRNVYKQKVYGVAQAKISVGYEHATCPNVIWETQTAMLQGFDVDISDVGGWSLDIHHHYNFHEGILQKGDGSTLHLKQFPRTVRVVMGTGLQRPLVCKDCDGPAKDARLLTPVALTSGPDGSLYVGDFNLVRRLTPQGSVYTVLQLSATQVSYQYYLSLSPADGRLYISDPERHQILRVLNLDSVPDPSINWEPAVGSGERCIPGDETSCGDEGPAISAKLAHPKGLAIAADKTMYFADGTNIRSVDPDGIIHTLIGHHRHLNVWQPIPCQGAIPAQQAQLQWPTGLSLSPLDGSLHFIDDRLVLKLTADMKVKVVAGTPLHCHSHKEEKKSDGHSTRTENQHKSQNQDDDSSSTLGQVLALAFSPNGQLFIADSDSRKVNAIRVVDPAGRMADFAGRGHFFDKRECDCVASNSSATVPCQCWTEASITSRETLMSTTARFTSISAIAVSPDGVVNVADPTPCYRECDCVASNSSTTVPCQCWTEASITSRETLMSTTARFTSISAIAVSPDGVVNVADPTPCYRECDCVASNSSATVPCQCWTEASITSRETLMSTTARFTSISAIAVSPDGVVNVADPTPCYRECDCVASNSSATVPCQCWTEASITSRETLMSTTARFTSISAIAVSPDGVVNVADPTPCYRECDCVASNSSATVPCQCWTEASITSRETLMSTTARFTSISAISVSPDGVVNVADPIPCYRECDCVASNSSATVPCQCWTEASITSRETLMSTTARFTSISAIAVSPDCVVNVADPTPCYRECDCVASNSSATVPCQCWTEASITSRETLMSTTARFTSISAISVSPDGVVNIADPIPCYRECDCVASNSSATVPCQCWTEASITSRETLMSTTARFTSISAIAVSPDGVVNVADPTPCYRECDCVASNSSATVPCQCWTEASITSRETLMSTTARFTSISAISVSPDGVVNVADPIPCYRECDCVASNSSATVPCQCWTEASITSRETLMSTTARFTSISAIAVSPDGVVNVADPIPCYRECDCVASNSSATVPCQCWTEASITSRETLMSTTARFTSISAIAVSPDCVVNVADPTPCYRECDCVASNSSATVPCQCWTEASITSRETLMSTTARFTSISAIAVSPDGVVNVADPTPCYRECDCVASNSSATVPCQCWTEASITSRETLMSTTARFTSISAIAVSPDCVVNVADPTPCYRECDCVASNSSATVPCQCWTEASITSRETLMSTTARFTSISAISVSPDGVVNVADPIPCYRECDCVASNSSATVPCQCWTEASITSRETLMSTTARFTSISAIAVSPDGVVNVADPIPCYRECDCVASNSSATVPCQCWTEASITSRETLMSTTARFTSISAIAVSPDGVVNVADPIPCYRECDCVASNSSTTVPCQCWTEASITSRETLMSTTARFTSISAIAVSPDGVVNVADPIPCYRECDCVASNSSATVPCQCWTEASITSRETLMSTTARFTSISAIAVSPDGVVNVADQGNLHILALEHYLATHDENGEFRIPYTPTGEEYIFNRYGQHITTRDITTGKPKYTFLYSKNTSFGKLSTVTDSAGNKILFLRDYSNVVSAIENTQDHKCELNISGVGFLTKFSEKGRSEVVLDYDSNTGLLTSRADLLAGGGSTFLYQYDGLGRLSHVVLPTGESINLASRLTADDQLEVQVSSPVQASVSADSAVHITTFKMEGHSNKKMTIREGLSGLSEALSLRNGSFVLRHHSGSSVQVSAEARHPLLELSLPVEAEMFRLWSRQVGLRGPASNSMAWTYALVGDAGTSHQTIHRQLWVNNSRVLGVMYEQKTGRETILDSEKEPLLEVSFDGNGLPLSWQPGQTSLPVNITYDRFNRIESWTWGVQSEQYSYDRHGLLAEIKTKQDGSTLFTYNGGNMLSHVTLPSGRKFSLLYDELGGLRHVMLPSGTRHSFSAQPSLGFTRYTYTPPGSTRAYLQHFTHGGHLLQTVYPGDGARVLYRYHNSDQLAEVVHGEGVTQIKHVPNTELPSQILHTEKDFEYRWDYQYSGGLLQEERLDYSPKTGLSNAKFTYQYDDNFRVVSVQGRIGGQSLPEHVVQYNARTGAKQQLGQFTVSWPQPNETSLSDGTAVFNRGTNSYFQVSSVSVTIHRVEVFRMEFAYDSRNRISQTRTYTRNVGVNMYTNIKNLTWDPDGQLAAVEAQEPWGFKYDNNGNMLHLTYRANTIPMEYNVMDRIVKLGDGMYRYDNRGLVVQNAREEKFHYNAKGLLIRATKRGRFDVKYYYDHLDRLATRKDNYGNVTQFFYTNHQRPNEVSQIYSPRDGKLMSLVYDDRGHLIFAQVYRHKYYIATDQCGTPVMVFNQYGEGIREIMRSPYGHIVYDSNPYLYLPVDFCGGLLDQVTSLVHMSGGKVYDPLIGQWMSPMWDDVLNRVTNPRLLHLYRFNGNDPINVGQAQGHLADEESWLSRLGYDLSSLAPQLSKRQGAPQSDKFRVASGFYSQLSQKMMTGGLSSLSHPEAKMRLDPLSSMLAATRAQQTRSVYGMTSQHLQNWMLQPGSSSEPPFGRGILVSRQVSSRAVVHSVPTANAIYRDVITSVFNNTFLLPFTLVAHGALQDAFHFVKEDAWRASEDRAQLKRFGSQFNTTFHEKDGEAGSGKVLDVRIHRPNAVINLRYGTTLTRERQRLLHHCKTAALRKAWHRERDSLRNNVPASWDWTQQEADEILKLGAASGYDGEYVRDVDRYPELAEDPYNIRFVKKAQSRR